MHADEDGEKGMHWLLLGKLSSVYCGRHVRNFAKYKRVEEQCSSYIDMCAIILRICWVVKRAHFQDKSTADRLKTERERNGAEFETRGIEKGINRRRSHRKVSSCDFGGLWRSLRYHSTSCLVEIEPECCRLHGEDFITCNSTSRCSSVASTTLKASISMRKRTIWYCKLKR